MELYNSRLDTIALGRPAKQTVSKHDKNRWGTKATACKDIGRQPGRETDRQTGAYMMTRSPKYANQETYEV